VRVRFTPRARNDLAEILKYIDERSPRGAQNVKRAVRKAIELIGEFSEGGLRPDRIGYVDSKVCKDQRDAKDFWYAAAITTRKLFMAKGTRKRTRTPNCFSTA
jgi:plasmid stabilization system protein ParE